MGGQQQVAALHLAELAVTVKVKKCGLSRTCGEMARGARATQASACFDAKILCAPACAKITRVVCAHHMHSKMALCATTSFTLSEVTAPQRYYQAKVFHALNASSVDLLQSVFCVFTPSPFFCPHQRAPEKMTGDSGAPWSNPRLICTLSDNTVPKHAFMQLLQFRCNQSRRERAKAL